MNNDWVLALLFFLPAGVANASPVFANKTPLLNRWSTPIDFGYSWRGKRLLGDNKRWRGLVFGTAIGAFTGTLVHLLQPGVIENIEVVSMTPLLDMVIIGGLLGLGALAGDAIESLIKRRLGIEPGQRWFPFDQIDYIIGGLVVATLFVDLTLGLAVKILVLYFSLHLLFSYLGYLLGLKDKPI